MSIVNTSTNRSSVLKTTEEPSLKNKALRSSAWVAGSQVFNNALRLSGNMVLTRLLFPEAFGLMLLVGVFTSGLQMFTDLGISQNIIQAENGDKPEFLNTAWTMCVLRGLLLWLVSLLLAWPFATFYQEPQLMYLIPVVSFSVLITGFTSTRVATLNRRLDLKKVCLIETTTQIVNLIATVTFAMIWPSVWSLVFGAIVSAFSRVLLSHTMLLGHKVSFAWDSDSAAQLYHFGRWIFISTVFTFMARQADKILLGRLISSQELGVYGIALVWAVVPTELMFKISNQVAFPVFSRLKESGVSLAVSDVARIRRPLSVLGGVITSVLIVCGDGLMHLLYDGRYADAGWILQLLALSVWVQMLSNNFVNVILALGHTKWLAVGNLSKFVMMLFAAPIGFYMYGLKGVVLGIAISEIVKYLVFTIFLQRVKICQFKEDLGFTLVVCLVVLLCFEISNFFELGIFAQTIVNLIVSFLVWSPFFVLIIRLLKKKKVVDSI